MPRRAARGRGGLHRPRGSQRARPSRAGRPGRLEAPRAGRARAGRRGDHAARRAGGRRWSPATRRSTATASTRPTCASWAGRSRCSALPRRSAWSTASASGPSAPPAPGGWSGATIERRDRRRVGDRQDRPGPPHGRPDGRGLPAVRIRPPRRLRDARAPRRAAGRGLSPIHRRSFQSVAYPGLSVDGRPRSRSPTAPGRWRTRGPEAAQAHRDEVEADRAPGELRAPARKRLGRAADAGPLGGRDRLDGPPRPPRALTSQTATTPPRAATRSSSPPAPRQARARIRPAPPPQVPAGGRSPRRPSSVVASHGRHPRAPRRDGATPDLSAGGASRAAVRGPGAHFAPAEAGRRGRRRAAGSPGARRAARARCSPPGATSLGESGWKSEARYWIWPRPGPSSVCPPP